MRRCHARSSGFSGHYQDLGISSKGHDSACKLIVSVVAQASESIVMSGGYEDDEELEAGAKASPS